jgi:hypothetical protein
MAVSSSTWLPGSGIGKVGPLAFLGPGPVGPIGPFGPGTSSAHWPNWAWVLLAHLGPGPAGPLGPGPVRPIGPIGYIRGIPHTVKIYIMYITVYIYTVRFISFAFLIERAADLEFCPNSEIEDYACLYLAGERSQPRPLHINPFKLVGKFESHYFVSIQIQIPRLYIWRWTETNSPSEFEKAEIKNLIVYIRYIIVYVTISFQACYQATSARCIFCTPRLTLLFEKLFLTMAPKRSTVAMAKINDRGVRNASLICADCGQSSADDEKD